MVSMRVFRGRRHDAPSERPRRLVFMAAGWVFAAVSALGLVSYLLPPDNATALGPAAVSIYIIAGAIPALACFAFARRLVGSVVSAALIVALVVIAAPLYVAADPPANARNLVVMTSNMKLGRADAAEVVREVKAHRVDVLMAQELTEEMQAGLEKAGIDAVLPHSVTRPKYGGEGTGLWSRYPLSNKTDLPLQFEAVAARIAIPGVSDRPTVAAIHAAGPIPDTGDWNKDYDALPGVLRGLAKDAPVIVGGDFNATFGVSKFRDLLEGGYADAGEQAGAGLLRTFPSDRWFPPVMGIDHVLTRGGAVGTSAETVEIKDTDHRAVLVTVAVPRGS
ncbi:endonuclease/exonuclease/phosphatase family protein [Jatrophihabitans fulvus]